MKKNTYLSILISSLVILSACATTKKFPTNTSGGTFSLNGNWKLVFSSDNNAQLGTVVTVSPEIASAFVKTLENNSYCYRAGDEAWRVVSAQSGDGFSINHLANSCNGTAIYKSGQIIVLKNNQIRINAKTMNDILLIQEWTRETN